MSVVELSIEAGILHCEVVGMHKIWSLTSSLNIALEHIRGVEIRPAEAHSWWHGWKTMGTQLPGIVTAGLFRANGKWVFWDVSSPNNAIEIDLKDEIYDRILIEVENPEDSVAMILEAMNSHRLS